MIKIYKAILSRDRNILKNYVVLSKLLKLNKMENYLYVASKRIIDYTINNKQMSEHIVIDYLSNDIWLDINAYIRLKPILLGYLEVHQYINILEHMNSLRLKSTILGEIMLILQEMNKRKLFRKIFDGLKGENKKYNLNITLLALLELLSRTIIIRIYYKIKSNIKLNKARKTAFMLMEVSKLSNENVA